MDNIPEVMPVIAENVDDSDNPESSGMRDTTNNTNTTNTLENKSISLDRVRSYPYKVKKTLQDGSVREYKYVRRYVGVKPANSTRDNTERQEKIKRTRLRALIRTANIDKLDELLSMFT